MPFLMLKNLFILKINFLIRMQAKNLKHTVQDGRNFFLLLLTLFFFLVCQCVFRHQGIETPRPNLEEIRGGAESVTNLFCLGFPLYQKQGEYL